MPLTAKKHQRTEKVTPAQLDEAALPAEEREQAPAQPKVTALICSYNNAAALRLCLAALDASSERARMEIVVVDKGSQDESPTLDDEFPNATFLRLPRNFGNAKAFNIGLRTGVGELVLFLSATVEVAPDTVAALIASLEADPNTIAVCPLVTGEDGRPAVQAYRLPTPQTGAELLPVSLETMNGPFTAEYASFDAMLARKYFIRGINYFDEHYGEFGPEAELGFQIRRAGRKLLILPDIAVVAKGGGYRPRPNAESLIAADRVAGLAVFFGKHYGFLSGLGFRTSQILKALIGFRFSLLGSLVSGQKIDGSQSILL